MTIILNNIQKKYEYELTMNILKFIIEYIRSIKEDSSNILSESKGSALYNVQL